MRETIWFYSNKEHYKELSNLFPAKIFHGGREWDSVEHRYQYLKFKAEYKDVAEWIIKAPRPSAVAIAAHGYNNYPKYVREDWNDVKVGFMRELVYCKFSQHPELWKVLDGTGDALLVEDSPYDSFWGCGKDKGGVNMLGKILVATRHALRKEKGASG